MAAHISTDPAVNYITGETGKRFPRNSRFCQETGIAEGTACRGRYRLRRARASRARLRAVVRGGDPAAGDSRPGGDRRWRAAEDGWTAVDVVTGPDLQEEARCCPDCGTRAVKAKETVTTTPRDVCLGDRQVRLRWRKKRWTCGNPGCPRGTFTESLPAVRPRARLTARLRRPARRGGRRRADARRRSRPPLRRLGPHRRRRVHRIRRRAAR